MARVAVVQMISSTNWQDNLALLATWFENAHQAQARLIVLPENFAWMGTAEADKLALAEVYGQGRIQAAVSQLAKWYQLWVVSGTIPLRAACSNKVRASCLVFNDSGDCVARYDKIHLFDVQVSAHEAHQESRSTEPGDAVVVIDTPIGCIGLSVCYDLRFPELYRQMVLQGAQLFAVPAAFTAITGKAHWNVLLRARAIENLCYVLASNQGGQHENGRKTYGHSMVIDPWGRVIAQQRVGAGMIIADIDLAMLSKTRQRFPSLEHRVL